VTVNISFEELDLDFFDGLIDLLKLLGLSMSVYFAWKGCGVVVTIRERRKRQRREVDRQEKPGRERGNGQG